MCKNDITHQFNVYTSKKTVLYVLQYLNISYSFTVIRDECMEDLSRFVFLPPSSCFYGSNCLKLEADG